MKIAFVINDIQTEADNYTTIRLARKASSRGHDVALIGLGDFIYDAGGEICGMATVAQKKSFKSDTTYLAHLQDDNEPQRVSLADYDILMLRSDPAEELVARSWAPSSGHLFAQLAARGGTIVLNDPEHLTDAANKTYFQNFPEDVRPATCITRVESEIKDFLKAHKGKGVLKPLQGSGGQGVFIITGNKQQNLNQIIEATNPRRLCHRTGISARGRGRRRTDAHAQRAAVGGGRHLCLPASDKRQGRQPFQYLGGRDERNHQA